MSISPFRLGLELESGHADAAPKAAVALGVLREEQGDLTQAAVAYQLALDSGHVEEAANAAFHLRLLLSKQRRSRLSLRRIWRLRRRPGSKA